VDATAFRQQMNRIEDCDAQLAAVAEYFDRVAQHGDRLPAATPSPEMETAE
jgi:tRNA-dihydrouridine synthase B